MFNVVLVTSVRAYREAIAFALAGHPRLTVRTEASAPEALAAMVSVRPDVLLIDVGLPALFDLLAPLHQGALQLPTIGIAIDIRTNGHLENLVKAAEMGMTGFVDVDQTLDDVVTVAERAAEGRSFCSPRIAAALMQAWRAETVDRTVPTGSSVLLTRRESVVAGLAARGLTNREIATRLTIAESTVKTHIHSILAKLDLDRRYEIAPAVTRDGCARGCVNENACTADHVAQIADPLSQAVPPTLSLVAQRWRNDR